jgi:hypothetical protein
MDVNKLVQTEADALRVENMHLRRIVKVYEGELGICLAAIKRLAFIDGVIMCGECGMLWPDERYDNGAQKCYCKDIGYKCKECVEKVTETGGWTEIQPLSIGQPKQYQCKRCEKIIKY